MLIRFKSKARDSTTQGGSFRTRPDPFDAIAQRVRPARAQESQDPFDHVLRPLYSTKQLHPMEQVNQSLKQRLLLFRFLNRLVFKKE